MTVSMFLWKRKWYPIEENVDSRLSLSIVCLHIDIIISIITFWSARSLFTLPLLREYHM